jgi:RNA polymerase sigma factor (sigma-70 family)
MRMISTARAGRAAGTPARVASSLPTRRTAEVNGVLPPALGAVLAATDLTTKETAWKVFVEVYTPLLLHTAYRFGHTYDDAMDRYTYLLDHLHHNDCRRLRAFAAAGPGRFSTWLVVVARRLFLDYHRERYGRRPPGAAAQGDESAALRARRRFLTEMIGEEIPLSAIEDGSVPNPEAAAQAAERAEAVRSALNALEPRDQLLLKLRFYEELAAREIADVMGFPSQFHVYRRLRSVLALLARRLPRAYTGDIH